jgi:hypothetical protein
MKVGAEPKKIAILTVLAVAAAYLVYTNVFSAPPGSSASVAQARALRQPALDPALQAPAAQTAPSSNRSANRRVTSQEFRPAYKRKGGVDTSTIDPKLRLDLLAKVQSVELAPAERNLFQFGAAPVVVNGPPPIIPKTPAQIAQEQAAAQQNNGPPPPPPPPPITLKYYGYTARRADGHKRAFFLDGDDIFVAAEGDLVKRRYKIVRIGVNSVVVEDTQFNNNTQTLPLAEESAG